MKEERIAICLRIPKKLHKKLRKRAKRCRRSLNFLVVAYLEYVAGQPYA